MKDLRHYIAYLTTMAVCTLSTTYAQTQPTWNSPGGQTLRIGIVNTSKCLEESKLGKQERANLEKMEKQMEATLKEKQEALEDVERKLEEDEEMDGILDEEEVQKLKNKKRKIRTEGAQMQQQYMQTLQQARFKIMQKVTETIGKASALVAQDVTSGQPVDVIFTDEACTYFAPHLDLSEKVIAKMNTMFDNEQKENASKSTAPYPKP